MAAAGRISPRWGFVTLIVKPNFVHFYLPASQVNTCSTSLTKWYLPGMKPNDPPDLLTLTRKAKDVLQHLARQADTPEPLDVEAAIRGLLERHRHGPLRWAFYLIVDMNAGDIAWQHGLDRSLGAPAAGLTIQEFFQHIHPDYLPRYIAWALAVHEAYFRHPEVTSENPVYHITMPLRHADGAYYWYTQRSVPLQADGRGQLISYFNLYDYGGPWNVHNRRPMVPFITTEQQPNPVLEGEMFGLMSRQIHEQFTPTEQRLLENYMATDPAQPVWVGSADTRHEHNSNILHKARTLFCCDFANARAFAGFLKEAGLWVPADIPLPGG